jgi:hypothetical protein
LLGFTKATVGSWNNTTGGGQATPLLPMMPSSRECGMAGGNWTTDSGQTMVSKAVSTLPMVFVRKVSLVSGVPIFRRLELLPGWN